MNKKVLFFIVYFSAFSIFTAILIFCAEIVGFYFLGGEDLVEHFLSSGHSLGVYRMFSYGAAITLAADISFRFLIFCCNKNYCSLSIDIAIELIDDPTLQKIYLKKWLNNN